MIVAPWAADPSATSATTEKREVFMVGWCVGMMVRINQLASTPARCRRESRSNNESARQSSSENRSRQQGLRCFSSIMRSWWCEGSEKAMEASPLSRAEGGCGTKQCRTLFEKPLCSQKSMDLRGKLFVVRPSGLPRKRNGWGTRGKALSREDSGPPSAFLQQTAEAVTTNSCVPTRNPGREAKPFSNRALPPADRFIIPVTLPILCCGLTDGFS